MASFLPWFIVAAALPALLGAGLVLFTWRIAKKVSAALPPQGRFIDIDGARIHYLDEGSGPPVLLIHGLGGQMRNFTHSLAGKLKGEFRVIVLDRPGNGYSTLPKAASAALGAQAGLIARFIEALGLEQPLIVGHSLGGAISLSLALNHPGQVGALALIAPLTQPQQAVAAPFRGLMIRSPALRRIIAWTLATPSSIARRNVVLQTVFGPDPVPPDLATKGGGLLSLRPSSFIGASTDLMAIPEDLPGQAEHYASIAVPAGVLFGTGDRILDFRTHGEGLAAQLPGLDLELVENGGHMLPVSAADRCAKFIARMARRLPAGKEIRLNAKAAEVSPNDA